MKTTGIDRRLSNRIERRLRTGTQVIFFVATCFCILFSGFWIARPEAPLTFMFTLAFGFLLVAVALNIYQLIHDMAQRIRQLEERLEEVENAEQG